MSKIGCNDYRIANEAVAKGAFGSHFSMNRMSWIKPSFLWMMYRCGWGTKEYVDDWIVNTFIWKMWEWCLQEMQKIKGMC
ncbi:MAG: DUF4291 family protein [Lachnospiraceae bacterium]|nr:DUF4291 family protein [Lachnospiraceae bacterium]